jgi:signal transduction histidine kinase
MLAQVVDQTRNLAKGFYPVELQKHGLAVGLQELAGHIKQSFAISCVTQSDVTLHPESMEPIAIQLFRIAQEAAHNAIKHAHARQILIHLARIENNLVLTVQDDGIGLPRNVDQSPGMGLRIMQYRARLIGGKMEFCDGGSPGTIITCSVPIEDWTSIQPKQKHRPKKADSRGNTVEVSRSNAE